MLPFPLLALPIRRLAAGALLAACGGRPGADAGPPPAADSQPPSARAATPMPVDSSATLFHAYQSGYDEPTTLVVRDRAAWEAAWARLHRGGGAPVAPAVDFGRDVVVVVALGERPSGGHDVSVDRVTPDASGGGATVTYTAREPGEGCMTTQAITSPAVAVRVPRIAGAVRFDRRGVRSAC